MDKVLTHHEIVDQLSNNMIIGIGGWGARRKPMSLIRAICQSDLKDLTGACADWKKAASLGYTNSAEWVANQCN
jgi:acyl CoA:acetate/3-ketoacid CoA transferase alpha subunit